MSKIEREGYRFRSRRGSLPQEKQEGHHLESDYAGNLENLSPSLDDDDIPLSIYATVVVWEENMIESWIGESRSESRVRELESR